MIEDRIAKEIRKKIPKLKKLNIILFELKNRILKSLLDNKSITSNEIKDKLKEKKVDMQSVLDDLVFEKILIVEQKKYSINEGLETFLKMSRLFLESEEKKSFMYSQYLLDSFNSGEVQSYVINRFFLKPKNDELLVILRMCLVSPSALYYILFNSNKAAKNLMSQFKGQLTDKIHEDNLRTLTAELTLWILYDFKKYPVLGSQNTKGISIDVGIKLTTQTELFLSAKTHLVYTLAKASGGINFGEAVTASNPQMFLETANILTQFGERKRAVNELEKALEFFENKGDWIYDVLINKGLILHQIAKLEKKEKAFDEAEKKFPKKNLHLLNFGNLLLDRNNINKSKKKLNKANREIKNNFKILFGLSRIALAEGNEIDCIKLLKKSATLEPRVIELINSHEGFDKIKKHNRFIEIQKIIYSKNK